MLTAVKGLLQRGLHRFGLRLEAIEPSTLHPDFPADFNRQEIEDVLAVLPYTMTSRERLVSLIRAVHYVLDREIPGDIVECGVWRGGSMMTVARTLHRRGVTDRRLWLYDTFTGMTRPGDADVSAANQPALQTWERQPGWCLAGLEEVRHNLDGTGYPAANLRYVVGEVEKTIPEQIPDQIALLRLDTDWYESTRHEMQHLFPRLSRGGVLILDDYGYWQGARKAVDEYLQATKTPLLLCRIDSTGRIAVKLE